MFFCSPIQQLFNKTFRNLSLFDFYTEIKLLSHFLKHKTSIRPTCSTGHLTLVNTQIHLDHHVAEESKSRMTESLKVLQRLCCHFIGHHK